jgi:tetraprenyl-beta-curcumene synthase
VGRAHAIDDPLLRGLALEKLRDQRLHAQTAATLATLAPSRSRRHVVRAIVALQVMYDYLDALTEQPLSDPLEAGRCLSRAFADAIATDRQPGGDYYALYPRSDGGRYLKALVDDVHGALAQLPARFETNEVARRCAARFIEAQLRAHAVDRLGSAQLREWATREAKGKMLGWVAYFAGATSSVVGLHALITAAADPHTTRQEAAHLDDTYLYIGVLITLLDSLADYEHDVERTGRGGYISYYPDREVLQSELTCAARQALDHARSAPHAGHHLMTLVGGVAFYASLPSARSQLARPVLAHIQRELQPLVTPMLVFMRAWRLALRLRREMSRRMDA